MATQATKTMLPEQPIGGKPTYHTVPLSVETKKQFDQALKTLALIKAKAQSAIDTRYTAPEGHEIRIFSRFGEWKFAAVRIEAKSGKGETVDFTI